MQIVDSSMFGLRTVRSVFRDRAGEVSVSLFPMIHVGEEQFYRKTYGQAFQHDIVLIEGLRSPVARRLTRSYRWIPLKKLGLIRQPKAPDESAVDAKIVLADLNTEEFEAEWAKIPLWMRLLFQIGAPSYGLMMRFSASRARLAKNMSLEDIKSADEILTSPALEPITQCIIDTRDKRLIDCLSNEIDSNKVAGTRIAVVYGAKHMRAVIRELSRRGFVSVGSDWQTVFSAND